MSERRQSSTPNGSTIECIEVLVPREFMGDSVDNLFWTLSVYSLENRPVESDRSVHHFDVFHFMFYDWERTIKALLESQGVPYSLVQKFTLETLSSDNPNTGTNTPDHQNARLSVAEGLHTSSPLEILDCVHSIEEESAGVLQN